VVVIHPGVNLNDYAAYDREAVRIRVRKEYGISVDEPVLVFASMNFEIKGLDAIIDALARLKAQGCNFKLLVAGKGNVRKYSRMAQKAGIAEKIIFTGQLDKEHLIQHYLAGDMYIMLSAFDTFGMVVLEAMAAGLPVIISANVGAKDVVRQGVNGFIIENPSDKDDIAAKIKCLMDRNTREEMSRSALATAAQNSWASAAAKYSQIYDDILAAHRN
jgi:UDP-glucose:(heptosyl)LPS alpha-1,3-glucosyltransferase